MKAFSTLRQALCGLVATLSCVAPALAAPGDYINDQNIAFSSSASEIVYAPKSRKLVVRSGGTLVTVIDLDTMRKTAHQSTYQFTNMSLSPSGRSLFVADYGGENIGYGTPLHQSYVHRLNLDKGRWIVQKAYIAGGVQAVSDLKLLLKSKDQWVTFTNNVLTTEGELKPVNEPAGYWGPAAYAGVYSGDFRFVPATGRLIHGNSGSSSQEIKAFRVVDDNFVGAESSGTYGSAQGFGGSTVLSNDGRTFYYGRLAVDANDVTFRKAVFPEVIHAATGTIAFGDGALYDATTTTMVRHLGFSTKVYGLNPAGEDFWAFDPAALLLRHFVPR